MPWYSWSKTAASNATADSTVNWSEGQAPSSVNDSARAMMASTAKWRDDISGTITTGGTSTAYTLTTNSVFDSLAHMSGQMIAFIPHTTCGASPTINVDGLGAKPLRSAPSVDLISGSLLQGGLYTAAYFNATSEWIAFNFIGAQPLGANSVATASIQNDAVTYAKMQNVAASRLLGNATGAATDPTEIPLTAALQFTGGSLDLVQLTQAFMPAGSVVKSISATYTANAGLATTIPADDTIPQIGEGTQIISQAYTPQTVTNKLRLRFVGQCTAGGADAVCVAFFQDSAANAIAAQYVNISGAGIAETAVLEHEFTPGSVSPLTISVRAGASTVNAYFNGTNAARRLGGVSAARLTIEEIKV